MSPSPQQNISEAEWEVMEVLWQQAPRTAGQIIDALKERDWNHRTIRTLLSRLVKKEVLSVEIRGRDYLYQPTVAREACTRVASRRFLDRFFRGDSADLLVHFLETSDLSPDDINELERMLHAKKGTDV